MVRIGKGQAITLEASLEEAARAAVAPQMALFFCKPGTLEEAARFMADRFPGIPTLGLCSIGVVSNGVVDSPDILLISFEEDFRIFCGLIRDLRECPVQHIYGFKTAVDAIDAGQDDTVCIEYCTNSEEMLVTTLNAVLDKYGIPLVGATAFEGIEQMGRCQVAYCGDVYRDACIYALVKCLKGNVRTYYENIYMRTEYTVHQITKADVENRRIVEIDGRPAADVYCDALMIQREDILKMNQRYPFGRVLGNRIFVADVGEVRPDGSLCCNKRINPNDAICFMDYGRYREAAQETIEKILQENPRCCFTLTGDCVHRFWLYQDEKFLDKHAANLHRLGPHAGTICGGEQFHHQHINQGLVMAVFSHTEEETAP